MLGRQRLIAASTDNVVAWSALGRQHLLLCSLPNFASVAPVNVTRFSSCSATRRLPLLLYLLLPRPATQPSTRRFSGIVVGGAGSSNVAADVVVVIGGICSGGKGAVVTAAAVARILCHEVLGPRRELVLAQGDAEVGPHGHEAESLHLMCRSPHVGIFTEAPHARAHLREASLGRGKVEAQHDGRQLLGEEQLLPFFQRSPTSCLQVAQDPLNILVRHCSSKSAQDVLRLAQKHVAPPCGAHWRLGQGRGRRAGGERGAGEVEVSPRSEALAIGHRDDAARGARLPNEVSELHEVLPSMQPPRQRQLDEAHRRAPRHAQMELLAAAIGVTHNNGHQVRRRRCDIRIRAMFGIARDVRRSGRWGGEAVWGGHGARGGAIGG
mmetsp:Transcript_153757/g.493008  ORF Transcript_153757/g.493008 Transcript_153757/m.493008 type:complete len:381 (-) Transcript_153757:434-1576(-)